MGLSQRAQVLEQDIHQISSVKQAACLGQIAETRDGRQFRYGLAGASNLALGKLTQQSAVVTTHQNITVAGSAGDMTATVTLGATNSTTLNQYQDGYLSGLSGTGAGQVVRIKGNPVITFSTSGTIYLDEPLTTTFAATPKASLTKNPYSGLLISDHTVTTQKVTGVPIIAVTAAYYGWFQTKGVAAVLVNGTITLGAGVINGATTDGSLDIEGTSTITERLGFIYDTAGASTTYATVYLDIK